MTTPDKPAIPAELVDRMVAFLCNLSKWDSSFLLEGDAQICRRIVGALPKPVDPDLIEARALADEMGWSVADHVGIMKAIKRGRELAKTEYGERWDAIFGQGRHARQQSYFDGKRHD